MSSERPRPRQLTRLARILPLFDLSAETWDATPSTTNTNEGLHAWTNSLAGIKLTPVEALESRRKIDSDVSREIKMSLSTGILANPSNEMSHRMARDFDT
ncbi:hypothetical protein K438DRAFT_1997209 [Mycena galopus ATCC 62051]|nr:hypothetical protein K438DRAFT_1997209 [Mycena galopus ATCC 62051]